MMPQLYRFGITADSLAVLNLVLVTTRLITISKPSPIGSAGHYKSPLKRTQSNAHMYNIRRIKAHNKHFIRVS
jgi:hypothetical protein